MWYERFKMVYCQTYQNTGIYVFVKKGDSCVIILYYKNEWLQIRKENVNLYVIARLKQLHY